jgi:hypothetical protein
MADQDSTLAATGPDAGRRTLLKAVLAAGGAAAAATVLPGSWSKPVAGIGALPAHAQTSEAPIRIISYGILGTTPVPGNSPAPQLMIAAWCQYEDDLGQVTKKTGLETEVLPMTADARVVAPTCEQDQPVQDYPWHEFTPDSTPYAGSLYFNVVTPCTTGGYLKWRLHVGGRYSNSACWGLAAT